MNNQLLFLQPGGVKVPVKLEVFKHGGGMYLAAVNHEAGVHVPFLATATVMAAELRQALALVEAANEAKDQGHISRAEARERVAPAAPNWDWLTPAMVIKYVEESPVLHIYADDVRAALKPLMASPARTPGLRTGHFVGIQTATAPIARSQLEIDLEAIRPHLDRIKPNGKVNKSEIARVLSIPAGGSSWGRVKAVADIIVSSSTTAPAPRPAIQDENKRSAAA